MRKLDFRQDCEQYFVKEVTMGDEGRWFLILLASGLAVVVSGLTMGRLGSPQTYHIAGSYVPGEHRALYAASNTTGITCAGYSQAP